MTTTTTPSTVAAINTNTNQQQPPEDSTRARKHRRQGNNRNSQPQQEPSKKKQKTCDGPANDNVTSKGFKRHYAKHNYHDYSKVSPCHHVDLKNVRTSRGGVHNPFPIVLHSMLEQAERENFSDIVSWQPHGRAFLIHQPKVFVSKVLPLYFKHSKLSSFQRQLSLYGFVRLTHEGPDRGAYYHESFLKGRAFLCHNIQRTRVKGTWVRTSSSPETEPDFYSMDPVCDLNEINQDKPSIAKNSLFSQNDDGLRSNDFLTIDDLLVSTIYAPPILPSSTESQLMNPTLEYIDQRRCDNVMNQSHQGSYQNSISPNVFSGQGIAKFSGAPLDIALQPPPAFPSQVITKQDQLSQNFVAPDVNTSSSDFMAAFIEEQAFQSPQLLKERDHNIDTPSPKSTQDEVELALFLTDVDLETEGEFEVSNLVAFV